MALGKSSEALYPLVEAVSKGRDLKQNKYRFSYFDFQNPKQDPYNVEALRVRGSLFFLEGNYEQAAEDFDLAADKEGDEKPDLHYYHGLSLYHTGRLGEAIEAFHKCTRSRSTRPEVLRIHAQVLKEMGYFEEAQTLLKQEGD